MAARIAEDLIQAFENMAAVMIPHAELDPNLLARLAELEDVVQKAIAEGVGLKGELEEKRRELAKRREDVDNLREQYGLIQPEPSATLQTVVRIINAAGRR